MEAYERTEILSEIKALSSHYPRRQLAVADQTRWLNDYADDLARFTPADVRLACAAWRQGDHAKMPTPGELIALADKLLGARPAAVLALPPPGPVYSEEHKAEMRRRVAGLVHEVAAHAAARGPHQRRPGETDVDMARRLWPTRERRPADPFG